MVDKEFWGDPRAWGLICIGLLLIVLGLIVQKVGAGLCWVFGLPLAGVLLAGIAVYYLVWWENWSLLREKKGE
jgi:hypothetical protein